MNWPNCYAHQY